MPKHNPNASQLIIESLREADPFAKVICEKLRSIILKADPTIIEDWKWGPNYYKNGMVCGFWFFKKHVSFVFYQGALLKDKKKVLLENPGNVHNRHIKYTDVKQVDEKLLTEYITEAIINNEKGIVIKETKDKTVIIPDDFKKLLNKNKFLKYFQALAFSHRKEYVMWINDAKKEETRLRRLDQAIEKIKSKENMHDKYKKIMRYNNIMKYNKTVFILIFLFLSMAKISTAQTTKTYNYIAFGDSYTICTGATEKESWPVLLCENLKKQNISANLIGNPSRNGYSTQNLIDNELPLLNNKNIDFATLLIGVNDYVRGVDINTYEKNLIFIIDQIQLKLSDKQKLILITIPDFGVTNQGSLYGNPTEISKGISAFNFIIKKEAAKRNLKCVELFEISKQMGKEKDLVALDGLHPSAKEYAIWEKLIFSIAKNLLE